MLLIIGHQLFLCTGPATQTAQKQKSCTTKSFLMQDWVFRLGSDNILGRSTSLSFLICEFANLCICILQSQLSSFTSLNPLQISQFVGILSGGNTYFHLPIAVSRDIYETFIFVRSKVS